MLKLDVPKLLVKEISQEVALYNMGLAKPRLLTAEDFLAWPSLDTHLNSVRVSPKIFAASFERNLAKLESIDLYPVDIGLEIECENLNGWWSGLFGSRAPFNIWKWATDGSLRESGAEFISMKMPSSYSRLPLAFLWTCFEVLNKNIPDFSWRTSIHVHMNMLDENMEHVMKLFLLYCVFEDSLFAFANMKRKQSIFCVPVSRSEISHAISQFLREPGTRVKQFLMDNTSKYSALNLLPLTRYGTVEFRQLEGTANIRKIHRWITLLVALNNYAKNVSMDSLCDSILSLNTTSYYQVFKESVFTEKYSDYLDDNNLERHMSAGVRFAKECLANQTRVKLHPKSALASYLRSQEEKVGLKHKPLPSSTSAFVTAGWDQNPANIVWGIDPVSGNIGQIVHPQPQGND